MKKMKTNKFLLILFVLTLGNYAFAQDVTFDFTTRDLAYWRNQFGYINGSSLPGEYESLTEDGLILYNRTGYGSSFRLTGYFNLPNGWVGDIITTDAPYNVNWCGGGMKVSVKKNSNDEVVHEDSYYTLGSGYKNLDLIGVGCNDPGGCYLEIVLNQSYGTFDAPLNRLLNVTVTNLDNTYHPAFFEGPVGIGTDSPAYALDVADTIHAEAVLVDGKITADGLTTTSIQADSIKATNFIGDGSGLTNLAWTDNNDNIYRDSGNVGIGIANPNYALDVADTIHAEAVLVDGKITADGLTTTSIQADSIKATNFIGDGSGLTNLAWTDDDDNIYRDSGNVGIGIANPNYALDVADTIHAEAVLVDGDIYISNINKGIIMKSPSGNCWRGVISNFGVLRFRRITCPGREDTAHENARSSAFADQQPVSSNSQLVLFPNPTDEIINIKLTNSTEIKKATYKIYNSEGIVFKKGEMKNNGVNHYRLDVSSLSAGQYILEVRGPDGNILSTGRIAKK